MCAGNHPDRGFERDQERAEERGEREERRELEARHGDAPTRERRVLDFPTLIGGPHDGRPVPDWRRSRIVTAVQADAGFAYDVRFYVEGKWGIGGAGRGVRFMYWEGLTAQQAFVVVWERLVDLALEEWQ